MQKHRKYANEGWGYASNACFCKQLVGPQGPYEALKGLIKPLTALKDPYEPYKALKGLIRP